MRIVLDARKLRDFGIGTYIRNLVAELGALDPDTDYILLTKPGDDAAAVSTGPNLRAVIEKAKPYSIAEQWRVPLAVARARADLLHEPHYVLPPLIRCRTVVTIHDCIHLRFPRVPAQPRRAGLRAHDDSPGGSQGRPRS